MVARSDTSRTRAPRARRAEAALGARPKRGDPSATRKRLVLAAAQEFEAHGYHGCDTNGIARAAGYAPGTFYKHFADKRGVFLAVYNDWVRAEWDAIGALIEQRRGSATVHSLAESLADAVLAHHRAWPGFRASLRALVAVDPQVRAAHRRSRRRQLAALRRFGVRSPSGAAFLLLTVERVADALADGELEALGLKPKQVREFVADQLLTQLNPQRS